MVNCDKCEKKIGFFETKNEYEDEDGNELIYCSKCDEKHEEYFFYPGKKKGSYEITPEQVTNEHPEDKIDLDNKKREKVLMEVATLFIAKKDFKKALKKLESIFEKKSEADWYSKGNIYAILGKIKEAIKCYDEALFIDTHYAKAWYRKGSLLFESNKFENAIKCFENVIELQKDLEISYPKDSWLISAMFRRMVSLVMWNNKLVASKKPSKELSGKTLESIQEMFPYLATSVVVDENEEGQELMVDFGFYTDNINDFVDNCMNDFNKILDVFEPRVVYEASGQHKPRH